MRTDDFSSVKITNKIEGIASLNIYQGLNGTWHGSILFERDTERCYPDMRYRIEAGGGAWFEWSISEHFYPNMDDDERLDVLTVKMAMFLLECYMIDKTGKVAAQLTEIARPHWNAQRKVTA